MKHRLIRLSAATALLAVSAAQAAPAAASPSQSPSASPVRVVVQFADTQVASAMLQSGGPIVLDRASAQAVAQSLTTLHRARASDLTQAAGGQVQFHRLMGSGHAVYTAAGDPLATVARLRATPGVASAEIDMPVHPAQAAQGTGNGGYNDPQAANQWWHEPGGTFAGGANVWAAHQLGARGQGRVIAVLDTGLANHPDLPAMAAQHDFIAGAAEAGDGSGRDADATDPGDFCTAEGTKSTWHGTSTTGLIAATANNSQSFVGAAPAATMMHVRVLGRCGGYMSDVADALRWLAGQNIPGVPTATLRPHIVNMSLGASGSCPVYLQTAVDVANSADMLLVASAGNRGLGARDAPASCTGVVSVGAASASGDITNYTSTGSGVTLLAPGGGYCAGGGLCDARPLTALSNGGEYSVGAPIASPFTGTSAAAPMVSAAAAAVWGVRPDMSAAQVRATLLATTRPVPPGSRCATDPEWVAFCGAGLLDVSAAVANALSNTPVAFVTVDAPAAPVARGARGTLRGMAAGPNDYAYAWQQLSGPPLTLTNTNSATVSYTAPAGASGTAVLRLTATSATLGTAIATAQVNIDSPPLLPASPALPLAAGAPLSLYLGASDLEGPVTLTLVSGPPGMVIQGGRLMWPSAVAGNHTAVVMATDSAGQDATTSYQLTVASAGSGGGGGGAADDASLAALAVICCAALAMRARGKRQEA